MQLLRQPVDKEKWTTEPAVVNAFYNPNKNDIGKDFKENLLETLFNANSMFSLSCWHSTTLVLQSTFSKIFKLWRHRGGNWSRNHPRF